MDEAVPVLVIGGGACGLVAALKAAEAGADVLVLERDASPAGSTSMSSGFIPAAGTRYQAALGIDDDPQQFAADIQAKAKCHAEPDLVQLATTSIGPILEWLADVHGLEWIVLDDFLYPGHSHYRMHAVAEKTGEALLARLVAAAQAAKISIVTNAHVNALFADDRGSIAGVSVERPDGSSEQIGCDALVLACNGFGGNRALVSRHIPVMANAPYYGHAGNQGDAILWGEAFGADIRCLAACQGHGSLAEPHGILITWALMMEGAIQVNSLGERFSNEHQGYSEQSIPVLKQPGSIAWSLFDERLRRFARSFPDFREAESAGAVRTGETAEMLAQATGLPADALLATLDQVARCQSGNDNDLHGRDFTTRPRLQPPYYAVKVTGALFHTQGGLMIDSDARVKRPDGSRLPNLYAGGGAACGVSGNSIAGYLSGNGLLTAIAFGAVGGASAAAFALGKSGGD